MWRCSLCGELDPPREKFTSPLGVVVSTLWKGRALFLAGHRTDQCKMTRGAADSPPASPLKLEILMRRTFTIVATLASAFALLTNIACTVDTPLAPSASSPTGGASDGSTLKVTAPTLTSPANNATVGGQITFRIGGSSGELGGRTLSYEFEVQSDSGAVLRTATVGSTNFVYPDAVKGDTAYRWRVRAALDGAVGPWSETRTFRTPAGPPGCVGGILVDPQAYFFSVINRSPGQSAPDWPGVLNASGIPGGFPPGVAPPASAPHYGLTQQFGGAGPRGVLFLPTATPDSNGFYSRQISVVDSGQRWTWIDRFPGGPSYAPRPCP